MSQRLHALILARLAQTPGLPAEAMARVLGAPVGDVRAALQGPLRLQVRQDADGCWSLAAAGARAEALPVHVSPATPLARLSRYYRSCLLYDAEGVSVRLRSEEADVDYAELTEPPAAASDLPDSEAVRRLLVRMTTGQRRCLAYVGYPVHLSAAGRGGDGDRALCVEPLLLFPAERDQGSGRLRIEPAFPVINRKPLQAFCNLEGEGLLSALAQLEKELVDGSPEVCVRPEAIAMRLSMLRPEWPWREPVTGGGFPKEAPPLAALDEPGIYDRAVVILADTSPYTYGLQRELRDLAALSDTDLSGTALQRWLTAGQTPPGQPAAGPRQTEGRVRAHASPLLQVTPMNAEQHEAVAAALSRPLTLITGPPGTGKSQVVTNLLINAAWSGRRVLFASKNNKAVDVVETRVNAVGLPSALLRMGAWPSVRTRLAEHVLALMSAAASSSDEEAFGESSAGLDSLLQEKAELVEEVQALVALRNEVDELEQAAEEARAGLGGDVFARAAGLDQDALAGAIDALARAVSRAEPPAASGFRSRLGARLWPLIATWRRASLKRWLERCREPVEAAGVRLPEACPRPHPARIRAHLEAARLRSGSIRRAAHYLHALRRLQAVRPLENITRCQADLASRLVRQSEALWRLWLRLRSSRLSAADRTKLSRYQSLLAIIMEAGEESQLSPQTRRQYAAMLKDVIHLLPCWAVTSLSARGRIPFEPGIFDIVVFDEASQCDIASALPLLYRAKSVVVIGDPRQLAHISGLPKGQDRSLLERHDLISDYAQWAYSYQSLFALAASQVSGDEVITLADHHRSHSDIIEFANTEFYQGRLRVATRYDQLRMPHPGGSGIRWVQVSGAVTRPAAGSAVNVPEAEAVVRVLRELVLAEGYGGTLGAVTPFRAQAAAISAAVAEDPALCAALAERRFVADTVHRFQGDERDVMIFSPVMAEGIHPGGRAFLSSHPNLFNVAITRARAQLIVVGDFEACLAGDVGYLSRFAAYTQRLSESPSSGRGSPSAGGNPDCPDSQAYGAASEWGEAFLEAACASGLSLLTGVRIEHYTADFLLIEGDRRLVIDIDARRYHSRWTADICRRDQIRCQRLSELGYDVMRFWVYELRDAMPACMSRLTAWREAVM